MISTSIINVSFAEDWIGMGLDLEPSWIAGFQFSEDETKDSSQTLYLSKTLAPQTSFDIQYSQSHLYDQTESFDSHTFYTQFSWPVDDEILLGLGYQFQGQSKEIEINQYELQIKYNPYPASFNLEYLTGDLNIFTRNDLDINKQFSSHVQSDLSAISVTIGWWFEYFQLSARHQSFDYEMDLSALGSRPLLQLLVKPGALVQTGLLISEQSRVSFDLPLQDRDLALHYLSSQSEVDHSKSRSWQLDWIESLTDSSRLTLSVNRSDADEDNWSLSAGLEWNR